MKIFFNEDGNITKTGIEMIGLIFMAVGLAIGVAIAHSAIVGFLLSIGIFMALLWTMEQAEV